MANNSELGKILVDGSGRTLYLFEADKEGSSTCYDKCAQMWPSLTTQGKPTSGQGASADKLGTFTRKNGDTQVTYNGTRSTTTPPMTNQAISRGRNSGNYYDACLTQPS